MDPKLDNLLCNKYPKIFKQRYQSDPVTWGIAVGDGWFNIIDQLCDNIQSRINLSRKERAFCLRRQRKGLELLDWEQKIIDTPAIQQVVAIQVKEKFGTLRFYCEGGDDYIRGMISMAESMSSVTCEICGSPGKLRSVRHWLFTACDEHYHERMSNQHE